MAEHCQHVWKYLHRLIYSGVLQSAQFYLFMWLFWSTLSTLKIPKSSPPQYWAGRVYDLYNYYMTGTPEGSTESFYGEAGNRTCDPWFTRHSTYPLHHGGFSINILKSYKEIMFIIHTQHLLGRT